MRLKVVFYVSLPCRWFHYGFKTRRVYLTVGEHYPALEMLNKKGEKPTIPGPSTSTTLRVTDRFARALKGWRFRR